MADNLLDKASILLTPTAYNDGSMLSVKPENGDGDFTFSRGSAATRVNAQGLVEEVTDTDSPRIDYTDGCGSWLLEPQSTNLYLNSDTLVTQSNATSASTYTVSFYGTGTITFSGTHTGTLVGTGANDRVSATFTATAGTLTSTISGNCEKAQLEQQSYATSYIPTNGSIATRLADEATNSGNSTLINSTEGVLYAEGYFEQTGSTNGLFAVSDGTFNNFLMVRFSPSNKLQTESTGGVNIIEGNARPSGSYKIAVKYSSSGVELWVDGSKIVETSTSPTMSGINQLMLGKSPFGNIAGYKNKAVAVFPILTDEQLQSLTTQ